MCDICKEILLSQCKDIDQMLLPLSVREEVNVWIKQADATAGKRQI